MINQIYKEVKAKLPSMGEPIEKANIRRKTMSYTNKDKVLKWRKRNRGCDALYSQYKQAISKDRNKAQRRVAHALTNLHK